jgi:hypothetical protein
MTLKLKSGSAELPVMLQSLLRFLECRETGPLAPQRGGLG